MNGNKNLCSKMELIKFLMSKHPEEITNEPEEPISNLLTNFEEIKTLLNIYKKQNLTKILYFNFRNIKKILYEAQEIIEINSEEMENEFSYLYYLSLLISHSDSEIVDYSFQIELINKLKIQENDNKFNIKKVFISKIILECINCYKETDYYKEEEESFLKEIEENNKKIIEENLVVFEEFKLDWNQEYFESKKIDELFIEFILSLIKKNSYNDILNIVQELDLKNINFSKKMKDKLFIFLNDNNNMKNYNIKTINDLFNEDKLNFYFILFKYLLKNYIYIYQNNFLNGTRKAIINLINSNKDEILDKYHNSNDKIKEQLKFILEFILNLSYYLNKLNFFNNNTNNNNNNTQNISSFRFNATSVEEERNNEREIPINSSYSSKQSSIFQHSSVKNARDNKGLNTFGSGNPSEEDREVNQFIEQILTDSTFKFHTNLKGQNPFIIYDEILCNGKKINDIKELTEKRLDNAMEPKLKNSYKKFINFLKDRENNIKEQFENKFKLEIILKFKRVNNGKNDSSYYNIKCTYEFRNPINDTMASFIDSDILSEEFILDGFNYLIQDINSED